MQGIDFSRIRVHDGSQHKGFEDLVCQLARRSRPENAYDFIPKHGAGGDAGVECYWKLNDDSEHAWQAKYFLNSLGQSQWNQISRSVETALNKHPKLTKYYVCLPKDRTDARLLDRKGKPILSELDKWNHYVRKWTSIAAKKSMAVKFVYWGKLQITSLILQSNPGDLTNITNYWFGATDGTTDAWLYRRFPTDLVDREIKKTTNILCQSRFFPEFDRVQFSLTLAKKLVDGNLSGGTDEVRSHALAWCARLLARNDESNKADTYLGFAKELGSCEEISIAEAFLMSQKGNEKPALSMLASIDTIGSRSAALMIVANHRGSQQALDWLESTGTKVEGLDSDGKYHLLKTHLELGNWDSAHTIADVLTDVELCSAPILHHMSAITHLLKAVPDEFKTSVSNYPPLKILEIHTLADNAVAISARRKALQSFNRAADIARQLECPQIAEVDDMYASWLELLDPDDSDKGRNRLESKLRGPNLVLQFVLYGIVFGLNLDIEAIERQIDHQIALNGGEVPFEAAIARYALAYKQETPAACANYIATYRDQLAVHFEEKSLQWMQIEMYTDAGLPDRATDLLDEMISEGLSDSEEHKLRSIIAEAEGADTVTSREALFGESNSLSDLATLVNELYKNEDWDGVSKYSTVLFERTRTVTDAERTALALYNTQEIERLTKFLDSNESLQSRSGQLKLLRCWTLYYEGKLQEASSEIEELRDWWDDPNCRELRVNIGISLGDWNSLSSVIAREFEMRNKRSAEELIRAAQLAFHLDLPQVQVKELTLAAVEKANDNANVLADAYFLASIAGWENTEEVANWLQRASALSGDDGPIRKTTIQEFVDQKPVLDRIQNEMWMKLHRGELPMYGAGHVLNKSLINTMSYPFFLNMAETDPRRRSTVFAYSGKKQHTHLDPGAKIAMDVSALLTLSSLDILDKALEAFKEVHISHSTLGWFFVERKKAVFHQPSRVKEAHEIRNMLAEATLEELTSDGVRYNDLTDQVGQEVAQLITEAETAGNEGDLQRIVVCPYPVHRVDSLMDEEADLTTHAEVLCSCVSVVEKLLFKGQITENVKRHACSFLRLHEKPWPDQPNIADGAILYLTNLATTYFHHVGVLEKLKNAGFRPVVSPSVVSEVDQLISYGNTSDKIETAIERIRLALRTGLVTGKVKTAPRVSPINPAMSADVPTEHSISDHPTNGMLALANQYDAIVVDDRFIGQYDHIIAESAVTPVFSSLDVINTLVSANSITNEDRMEYRMKLRDAGYILVPVDVDELIYHLDDASTENGEVEVTAGLKAIRDNLLLVRLSGCNLSVEENGWLSLIFMTFREAIKELWKRDGDTSNVRICSDWILSQLDIRGWAQSFERESAEYVVNAGHETHVTSLLLLPIEELKDLKEEYWDWLEKRVLGQIKEESPELYLDLVERFRRHIASMVDDFGNENEGHGE